MNTYEFWNEMDKIFDAVVAYKEKTVEFNKQFIDPWIKLGNVFEKQEDKEAVIIHKNAIEIDPANAQNWFELGNTYIRTAKYDKAIQAYQKALELGHHSGELNKNLALANAMTGKYEEAILLFEKSLSLLQDSKEKAVIWNHIGNVYRKLNNYEKALMAFQQADNLEIVNEEVHPLLEEEIKSDHLSSTDTATAMEEEVVPDDAHSIGSERKEEAPVLSATGEHGETQIVADEISMPTQEASEEPVSEQISGEVAINEKTHLEKANEKVEEQASELINSEMEVEKIVVHIGSTEGIENPLEAEQNNSAFQEEMTAEVSEFVGKEGSLVESVVSEDIEASIEVVGEAAPVALEREENIDLEISEDAVAEEVVEEILVSEDGEEQLEILTETDMAAEATQAEMEEEVSDPAAMEVTTDEITAHEEADEPIGEAATTDGISQASVEGMEEQFSESERDVTLEEYPPSEEVKRETTATVETFVQDDKEEVEKQISEPAVEDAIQENGDTAEKVSEIVEKTVTADDIAQVLKDDTELLTVVIDGDKEDKSIEETTVNKLAAKILKIINDRIALHEEKPNEIDLEAPNQNDTEESHEVDTADIKAELTIDASIEVENTAYAVMTNSAEIENEDDLDTDPVETSSVNEAYEEYLKDISVTDMNGQVDEPDEVSETFSALPAETETVTTASETVFDGTTEFDTKNAYVWNELGNAYFNASSYEDAIMAYSKAIELNQQFAWPYSNLALAYVQKGRFSEAILLYQRSIELFSNDNDKAVTWNRLGNLYRRMNDYENAIAAYQRADELAPAKSTVTQQNQMSLLGSEVV